MSIECGRAISAVVVVFETPCLSVLFGRGEKTSANRNSIVESLRQLNKLRARCVAQWRVPERNFSAAQSLNLVPDTLVHWGDTRLSAQLRIGPQSAG